MDQYASLIKGTGKPLVFLPSGGMPGMAGDILAEEWKDRYRIHMLDLPGIGGSRSETITWNRQAMADWVIGYLDEQHLDDVVLCGHSLGGALAISAAYHYPDRISKLILLDQGHKDFPRFPVSEFGALGLFVPFIRLLASIIGKPMYKRLTRLFSKETSIEQFYEQTKLPPSSYIEQTLQAPCMVHLEGVALMFGFYSESFRPLLQQITVPTILFYATFEGVNDGEMKKTSQAIQQLKAQPSPMLTFVPVKSGHFVHWSGEDTVRLITSSSTVENSP